MKRTSNAILNQLLSYWTCFKLVNEQQIRLFRFVYVRRNDVRYENDFNLTGVQNSINLDQLLQFASIISMDRLLKLAACWTELFMFVT